MRSLLIEGNNGGDFVKITQYASQKKEDVIYLESGSCCVHSMCHQVPVEFLSVLISNVILEHNGNVHKAVKETLKGFSKDFIEGRCSKIKKYE